MQTCHMDVSENTHLLDDELSEDIEDQSDPEESIDVDTDNEDSLSIEDQFQPAPVESISSSTTSTIGSSRLSVQQPPLHRRLGRTQSMIPTSLVSEEFPLDTPNGLPSITDIKSGARVSQSGSTAQDLRTHSLSVQFGADLRLILSGVQGQISSKRLESFVKTTVGLFCKTLVVHK